jgi:hypothetical protein
MRIIKALVSSYALAVVAVAPAGAQDEPKGYVCSFETGTSWNYDGGNFKPATPEPLTFEIAAIDLDKQSAQLVNAGGGGTSSAALKIVRAINANHFLEVVNEGFLNLTTIYDKDATSGVYPAVHSRHFGVLGQPVFAQYAGTCTAK